MKKLLITFSFILFSSIIHSQGAGNCIDFGSSGDKYINCGSPASLEISSAITVEAWIYPTTFNDANEVYAKMGGNKSGSYSGNYYSHSIELRSGRIYYRISHSGTGAVDVAGSVLSTNTWQHVVLTFDGTDIKGYVNGKLDANHPSPGSINTSTNNPFTIGSYMYYAWPFRGKIDEVRVWNVALSESTIRDWMHKEVTTSHPNYSNLKGYWKLNESSGTTATDASGNSANGTLTNSPSWASSTASIGSEGAFVSSTSQTNVGPTGGQLKTTITSTPDNSNNLGVYQFGSVDGSPVSGETYPSGIDKRTNIVWGIVERGTVTANLVFDYSQVSGITSPSTVMLIKRTDASSTAWTEVTLSSRDNDNKTLTVNGVTSYSEFAIGAGSDNPLPAELISFTGTANGNSIVLNWQTATEINNYGFSVERRTKSEEWIKIGFVQGHGNSNSTKNYSYIDYPSGGNNFSYRLKQIDFDGKFEYSDILEINFDIPNNTELAQNFPNPFNPSTAIKFTLNKPSSVIIKIFDSLGKEVKELLNEYKPSGSFIVYWNGTDKMNNKTASGVYICQLAVNGKVINSRKMNLMK